MKCRVFCSFTFYVTATVILASSLIDGNLVIDAKVEESETSIELHNQRLDVLEEDISEVRRAFAKLLFMLSDGKEKESSDNHDVVKREVTEDDLDALLTKLNMSKLFKYRGLPGRDGREGRHGRDGIPGTPGKEGKDGNAGPPGRDGIAGIAGRNGKDGLLGPPGKDGKEGKDGNTGPPGRDGRDGFAGTAGSDGEDGHIGPPGKDGKAGKDGADGKPGNDGAPGSAGLPGMNGTSIGTNGAVYTRWGRTTCGNKSALLYSGFVGGSGYSYNGGGVNYQCMPITPEYNLYSKNRSSPCDRNGQNGWCGSWINGAEYQSYNYGIFSDTTYNQNVPCARCHTSDRSSLMMIPSKRTCPPSWTKEYEGYLMTQRSSHNSPATFECVDAEPEYIAGQGFDTNGALFYFVKTACSGSGTTAHCPPYHADKELTCVVCSI